MQKEDGNSVDEALTGDFDLVQHDTVINSLLEMVQLRGGMVEGDEEAPNVDDDTIDDETHTPSLFSYDYPEELPQAQIRRSASGETSTFCTDDIPDPDPNPDAANSRIVQPTAMRRVTSATSVHATNTVVVTEPHQILLSRAVAEEDAERRPGVVATNSTPVQGATRNLAGVGPSLAEYVERRFGLDGVADVPENAESVEAPTLTLNAPDYENTCTRETIASIERGEDTELEQNNSRRLSAAMRNARSRLREFFPNSDVVTSSRASMEDDTSRRSRFSVVLRRTVSQSNLLTRASSRILPSNGPEQSPTSNEIPLSDGTPPSDEMPTSDEEGLFIRSGQSRRVSHQDTPPDLVETGTTSPPAGTLSEPVVDHTDRDAFVRDDLSEQQDIPDTYQAGDGTVDPETRTERQGSATSLMRRAVHRLSTSLPFGSSFSSRDDTQAPPPTRNGPPATEEDNHVDAEDQTQQNTQRTRSGLGSRLRHIGSSTLNLARRATPRFSEVQAGGAQDREDEGGSLDTDRKQPDLTNSRSARVRHSLRRIAHFLAVTSAGPQVGGVLEPPVPEGPRSIGEVNPSLSTVDNADQRSQNRARPSIFTEWQNSYRRATAPMRRRNTPDGHGCAQQVETELPESSSANNEEPAGVVAERALRENLRSQGLVRDDSWAGPSTGVQAGSSSNPQDQRPWKQSVMGRVRDITRSEQNVFTL